MSTLCMHVTEYSEIYVDQHISYSVKLRMKLFARRTDHDLSQTINQRRSSNPLVHRHNMCDRGVRKAKAQRMRYSACSASGAVGSKRGKGEPDDTDHDPDQYTEKKSFLDRS